MNRTACLFLAAALSLAPAAGVADPGPDDTAAAQDAVSRHRHDAEIARLRARADAARGAELAEQQVAAAAALRSLEDRTSADTQNLASLEAAQATAGARLAKAQATLERLLPVMQRLASQPAATMFAAPVTPRDAVRGIAILQGIAAEVETEAARVRQESQDLATLLAKMQSAQSRLSAAIAAQTAAEQNLTAQIDAAKAAEMTEADTAAREAAASFAAQRRLDSISATVASLVPRTGHPAELAPGAGGAPVAGHVIQAFGAQTLAGPAQGVSYGAAPGARVTTPCAGTVMFAGPFNVYGLVVITDCGNGTSIVLAGMDHLDVATGERLARGQPVGAMLGYNRADPAHQPVLYVELRQNGTPVDPTAWLAGRGSG